MTYTTACDRCKTVVAVEEYELPYAVDEAFQWPRPSRHQYTKVRGYMSDLCDECAKPLVEAAIKIQQEKHIETPI